MKKLNSSASAPARPALHTEEFTLKNGEIVEITHGSGNVFADLELPDADELFHKARLAAEIAAILQGQGLPQREAAQLVDVRQPDLSKLLHGHTERFSSDRLFAILNRLGYNVEVRIAKYAVKTGPARTIIT